MQARKSFIVFFSEYAQSAIGFLTTFIIARLMGPAEMGVIGYYLGLLGLFSICLDFGISTAHIKRVSEKRDVDVCVGTFLFLKSVLVFLYIVITLSYLFLTKSHFQNHVERGWIANAIFWLLFLYFIFREMLAITTSTFTGRGEFVKLSLPSVVGQIVKAVVAISAAFLGYGALGLAVAYVAESGSTLLLAGYLLARSQIKIKMPTKEMIMSYLSYAAPLVAIIPISVFISNVGRVMIEHLSNVEQVGFYFTIQTLIAIPNAISGSAMTVFLPKVSADHAQFDIKSLGTSLHKACRYLSLILMPLCVILIVLGDLVLRICFGPKFVPGWLTLVFLSAASYVGAVVRPYSYTFYGIEKHSKIVWISLASLAILVIGNCFFIPQSFWGMHALGLGAAGAALSQLIIWLFHGGIQIYLIKQLIAVGFDKRILLHSIGGGVMLFFLMFVRQLLEAHFFVSPFLSVPFLSILGILIYLASLSLLGEWSKKDWNYFLDLLNPSKFMKDVSTELK